MAKVANWRDLFKDKDGKVVLIERPNLPLIGWLVFLALGHLFDSAGCRWLSTAFIFTWAFLEITQGTTYFRRALGVIVFGAVIMAHV
jgi:hypothetical protein